MIRLLVVGQAGIELDGKRLTAESEIVFGVLLFLAARAGDTIARDEAQALFWPELSHKRGRHCLRQALYRLRQLGVPLRPEQELVGVALGDITSDYAALTVDDVPASTYKGLAIADILPAYQPTFSTPFSAWVEEFRSRIGLRIRQGLVRTIIDLRSKGRYREAEPLARACLTADPLNEIATLTLAEATVILSGNRAEAMAILDRYMEELAGLTDQRLAVPALVLRRRISESFVEQRYGAPPEPPFVGREQVLEWVVERMQEAVAGRSTVSYLWGEPGIGKTRILDELTKISSVQGVHVERYSVSPNDSDRPLALFSSLLPRLMHVGGAVGISTRAFGAIQRFVDPSKWEAVEPPSSIDEAARVFGDLKSGICELLEVLSEERPLAVFIDDLHWIDDRSLEVLSELVEKARPLRIAFALTSRELCTVGNAGAFPALFARASIRRLDGLAPAEIEQLLSQIAGQRSFVLSAEFVRRTIETSAGNPLFVSELATHYIWNGLRDDLPHNLQSLLQKRLAALSREAMLVFQACGVLGEHATAERIERMLEMPSHNLLRALCQIEESSLLTMHSEMVACRHELLRREALARLTPAARQTLYRRAASLLEVAACEQMSATMAWHAVHAWLDAAQPSRAVRLVTKIAGRLLNSGLAQDADALLDRARGVVHDAALVMELLPLQLRAARARGDLHRSLHLALECQALSQKLPSRSREAHLADVAAYEASRGLQAMRQQVDLDLCRIETSVEPPDVLLEIAQRVIIAADDSVDPTSAHRCFEYLNKRRTLERASFEARVFFELVYHSHFGDLDIAIDRAREIATPRRRGRKDDLSTKARRLRWAHRPLLISGDFDEALNALHRSIEVAKNCGSIFDEFASRCLCMEVLLAANRIDEALATLPVIEEQHAAVPGRLLQTTAMGLRADLLFALGRVDELAELVATLDRDGHPQGYTRVCVGIDAMYVLQALMRRCDPDPLRVERIMSFWPSISVMGAADTVFLAAIASCLCAGAEARAIKICLGYSTIRRERWPIPNTVAAQFEAMLSKWKVYPPEDFDRFKSGSIPTIAAAHLHQEP